MSRTRSLLAASLALVMCYPVSSVGQTGDLERLEAGLPQNFEKTQVVIYPLIDQRGLFQQSQTTGDSAKDRGLEAWNNFLMALRGYDNLNVRLPHQTLAAIQGEQRYQDALKLALDTVAQGKEAYKEVRLKRAISTLKAGIATLKEIEHHIVAPRVVADAMLKRSLALLEKGDTLGAQLSLREALLTDSTLRLKSDFDHPEALRVLNRTRASMVNDGPTAPPEFRLRETQRIHSSKVHVIRGRLLPGRLEVVVISSGSIRLKTQRVEPKIDDPGGRLANAVFHCLPFGKSKTRRHRPYVLMGVGFSHFIFADSPVGTFGNLGVSLHGSWRFSPHISLESEAIVSNSNRDSQEHIREDISSLRVRVNPAANWQLGTLGFSVNLGLEIAALSEVVITTNPGCKFFETQANAPRAVCDFNADIDRAGPTLAVGPTLALAGQMRVVDQFFVSLRANTTAFVFTTAESRLDWPIGGTVGLGYKLF